MWHVHAKSVSELGEVADALLGDDPDRSDEEPANGDVVGECADTMLTLLVLVGRFYPEADLIEAVRRKLDLLSDPTSKHRSSLGAVAETGTTTGRDGT
jgi:hypothetical protein